MREDTVRSMVVLCVTLAVSSIVGPVGVVVTVEHIQVDTLETLDMLMLSMPNSTKDPPSNWRTNTP